MQASGPPLYVRKKMNVQKRLLLQAAAHNLALLLRKMTAWDTAMQDAVPHLLLILLRLISAMNALITSGCHLFPNATSPPHSTRTTGEKTCLRDGHARCSLRIGGFVNWHRRLRLLEKPLDKPTSLP